MTVVLLLYQQGTPLVCSQENTCSAEDATCNSVADKCHDNHPASNECPYWAQNGECSKNPKFMEVECRKSCGICVDIGVPQTRESEFYKVTSAQTTRHLEEAEAYFQTARPELQELCRNQKELCTVWAVAGECEKNPDCKQGNNISS